MLRHKIEPRSSETNATGHIDHAVIPVWFELARTPIYKLFNPDLSFATWNTVIRSMTIDYLSQVFHEKMTEVKTCVGEIKNTSFTVMQELWQAGTKVAQGATVIVYFDYQNHRKQAIPRTVREKLLALQQQPD